jgi:hypothetical protein
MDDDFGCFDNEREVTEAVTADDDDDDDDDEDEDEDASNDIDGADDANGSGNSELVAGLGFALSGSIGKSDGLNKPVPVNCGIAAGGGDGDGDGDGLGSTYPARSSLRCFALLINSCSHNAISTSESSLSPPLSPLPLV